MGKVDASKAARFVNEAFFHLVHLPLDILAINLLSEEDVENLVIETEVDFVGFSDPPEFSDELFQDEEYGSLSFLVFCGDNHYSFLLDLFLDLFLNFNQLGEGYPGINNLEVFLNDSDQVFQVRLSSHIGFEGAQQFYQSFLELA